ncbi:serine hydrolase [Flavobacteriaceae bacterium R38]|nr:serine hydrolase [Flavobacteriaceae bacterium R38]
MLYLLFGLKKNNKLFFIAFTFILFLGCTSKTDKTTNHIDIDELFTGYNDKTPGYALGIIKNGELIYTKGFGLANLDYNIRLTDSSAFYIGSMAKQFTAAALLVLEAEEKLDFKRNVNDYLPDFPTYKYPITIEHLVHHTSGIRETNSLQLFQGIDRKFEATFTTDDLYELVKNQKDLNFQPGTEYRYSSGGYAVLAKVIEKVSGMSFRDFLQEKIFNRLDMDNTFVSDNHNDVVPNRVISYWPVDKDKWERRNLVFDAYGDGGIITTVKDLTKWDKAFYADLLGVKDFEQKMYQKGVLNNNREIEYARALQIRKYRGQTMITHNGGMLGFRVDMVRFPEQNTTIILLGNSAFMDPTGDALKVADIVLKDALDTEQVVPVSSNTIKPVDLPADALREKEGFYWTDQMNYFRRITFNNDSLFLDSGNLEYKNYLVPMNANEFSLEGFSPETRLIFNVNSKNGNNNLTIKSEGLERSFRLFDPENPKEIEELSIYEGTYRSEELKSLYTIFEKEDILFLQINENHPIQIFPTIQNGVVWNGKEMLWIGFGEIKLQFDNQRNVTGLIIGDQRVSGVSFKKIDNAE